MEQAFTLDLRTFVKTALQDILGGVADAQKDPEIGPNIVPTQIGTAPFPSDSGVVHQQRLILSAIKFDVAVTVGESSGTSKGGRLRISVVSADLKGEASSRSETVSRIQFAVPIRFTGGTGD